MLKESTHRANELKDLGWSNDDISKAFRKVTTLIQQTEHELMFEEC